MIVEGIVTTVGPDGRINIAPMGPIVDDHGDCEWTSLVLRPYKTSKTYHNLKRSPEGVFHVTDDVLLFARSVLEEVASATRPAAQVRCPRLADCCRWYEFHVVEIDDALDRTQISCRIVHHGRLRDFFGFNRAKNAVIEAAILVSRLSILPRDAINADLRRLHTIVEKTGGVAEREAFRILSEHVAALAELVQM